MCQSILQKHKLGGNLGLFDQRWAMIDRFQEKLSELRKCRSSASKTLESFASLNESLEKQIYQFE
jgi:hypothetical protein